MIQVFWGGHRGEVGRIPQSSQPAKNFGERCKLSHRGLEQSPKNLAFVMFEKAAKRGNTKDFAGYVVATML